MEETVKVPKYINVLSPDERKKLINSLLDIRLSLCVKKISKKTISKNELRNIVDESKKKVESDNIRTEIDKLFDEYFVIKKEETIPNINDNSSLSVEEMESLVNNKINYKEEGTAIAGSSLIKKDNHFSSSVNAEKSST